LRKTIRPFVNPPEGYFYHSLSKRFHQNIQACEETFVSVELCPISFNTQRLFYETSFQHCFDWSLIGGFSGKSLPGFQRFKITTEDIFRIMTTKKIQ